MCVLSSFFLTQLIFFGMVYIPPNILYSQQCKGSVLSVRKDNSSGRLILQKNLYSTTYTSMNQLCEINLSWLFHTIKSPETPYPKVIRALEVHFEDEVILSTSFECTNISTFKLEQIKVTMTTYWAFLLQCPTPTYSYIQSFHPSSGVKKVLLPSFR